MAWQEQDWNLPQLRKFVKRFSAGQHLFHQGEPGTTFFLVLKGTVRLTAQRDGEELMVSLMEPGKVLGEKCLVSEKPYKRFFGAIAETDVVTAELKASDMDVIERDAPKVANQILRKICQVSIDRLDRIDHLVKVLRSANNVERLVYLLVHFAYFEGQETERGDRFVLPLETIRYYIAMSPFEIEECLAELQKREILLAEAAGDYVLTDSEALIGAIPALKDALPDIRAI